MRQTGGPLVYLLGGWAPPLGVALRADGLSAVMMMITAVVICAVGVFAHADFRTPAGSVEARAPFAFWILLLAIWGALNTVFLGGDLFTLYVALELLTFAAVPLVCLDGRAETLQAALRYLLFALLGSVLYLVGTALLYGAYGTLDIVAAVPPGPRGAGDARRGRADDGGASRQDRALPAASVAAACPCRRAGRRQRRAVGAGGEGVVLHRRPALVRRDAGAAGPGRHGSCSLRSARRRSCSAASSRCDRSDLKLLIAYSTLAQIGYLFLMFPLAFDSRAAQLESGGALAGGMLQAISHATAKAAMFMAAGLIYAALGHDRIAGLIGVARALPMSVSAFALGGVALIGVPPSGAYLAKELLLQAAAETEQWWWAVVIQAGGIFTSSYLLLVLAHALAPASEPVRLLVPVSRIREAAALALALCSLLLGLLPWEAYLSVPAAIQSNPLALKALSTTLWPILGGAVLAILLGRWGHRLARIPFRSVLVATVGPARRTALTLGKMIERVDGMLRRWPAATLCPPCAGDPLRCGAAGGPVTPN